MTSIRKVIVTGGAGFIGSHIVDELLKRNIETFVIDNLSTGSLENLKQHADNNLLHIKIGDAKNIGKLMADISDIDVVFHEAAIASITRSITEPMVVHDVNVNTSLEIMNFCVANKIRRMIFASSAAVYGILKGKASEQQVCRPYSPYGATKLVVEEYLSAYHQTYGLETVALRYFNVFGARQKLNDYSGVITIFINQLMNNQTPTIFGDGLQTRDFIHVNDIVQANMLCMDSKNVVGEMFNVATGNPTNILDLLLTIKSVTGTENLPHKFGPQRPGDVKFGLANADKITQATGFVPKMTISEGLTDVVKHIRSKLSPTITV
ncbi:MAG TPA: NAD-dependent epimerase/dehydratase family protein [Candidatus Nitrosotalea sp.]|nr:NAD-dependent epimerase/dehydratase family protein [Candidatus Nitrosotalea sp.]